MKNIFKYLKNEGLFGWNYWYLIKNPWVIIKEMYYRTKWFIQRGYRGYADYDVWNLPFYLDSWLPKVLTQLKKNKLGYPIGLTHKKWTNILNDMIIGFKYNKKVSNLDSMDGKVLKKWNKKAQKGIKLFAKHYNSLWD